MSETPETDAAEKDMSGNGITVHTKFVTADFARKLERERDAAIAVIEAIEEIFIDGENTHDDWLAMGTIAREFLSENAEL